MGKIISADCKSCGFHQDYNVGCGIGIQSPGIISKSLGEEDSKKWDDLTAGNRVEFQQSENVLMRCPDCGTLETVLTTKVFLTDKSELTLGLKCRKCGNALEKVDMGHMPCPKCGSELETRTTGFWD
jgi:predicted RNA-binding Zn-ribbon protein involved in translation (DUF1610 family)